MISMADIAKEANVSRTTVSLALNNRYIDGVAISEELRTRVKQIATKRGYRHNVLASSMAKGKSRLIGCLGLDPSEEKALFVGQIMAAAAKEATTRGYSLKLLSSESTLEELLNECYGYRLSGVIVRSRTRSMFDKLVAGLKNYKIPTVLVDTNYDNPGVPSINSDDADGMCQAVHHLYELGHTRIAFMAFENYNPFTKVRIKGYMNGLAECGLPQDKNLCFYTDPSDLRPLYERMESLATEILQMPERPTAIIGNCDEVSLLVLRAAWKLGIKVPEQLSVVGFSNIAPAEFSCPALTSVGRPYTQMGKAAMDELIDYPDSNRKVILPVSIVLRQSTGTYINE